MKTLFKNADILLYENGIYNVIKNAFLAVDGEKISYIGKDRPEGEFDTVKDMSGKLLMSGFYNCHNHCPMVLLRGVGSEFAVKVKKSVHCIFVVIHGVFSPFEMLFFGS